MEIENELVYVFDSNAIYDYFESNDKNSQIYGNKFRNELKQKIKVIPSVCMMEIFVKKRCDPSYIKNLLEMIVTENFYLSFSQFVVYTADDLINFIKFSDDFLRIRFCNEQLIKKIDIESRLLALMEAYISLQFCDSCTRHYGLDEIKYKTQWAKDLQELVPFFKDKIKENLINGYSNNNEKQQAKFIWKLILFTNYSIINDDLNLIKNNNNYCYKDGYTKRIKNALTNGSQNTSFQKMQKLGINEYSIYINSDLDFFIDCIRDSGRDYTKNQLGYIKRILQNWILNGEALDKNDMSDLQYFYFDSKASLDSLKKCVDSNTDIKKENIRYISFDSDMYSYIKQISPDSYYEICKYLKNPKLKIYS